MLKLEKFSINGKICLIIYIAVSNNLIMFDTELHTSNELNSSSKEVRNLRLPSHRGFTSIQEKNFEYGRSFAYTKSCIVEASYNIFIQNVWGPFYPIFPLRSGPLFCIDVEHA